MSLIRLPNEILCRILGHLPAQTTIAMLRTCKLIYSLFDDRSKYGKHLWMTIRTNEGLPDPALINMSDSAFLRAYFGRGCNACNAHPRLRTPIWEFQGLRLCHRCFTEHTVSEAALTPNQLHYVYETYIPYFACYLPCYLGGKHYLRSAMYKKLPRSLAAPHALGLRTFRDALQNRKDKFDTQRSHMRQCRKMAIHAVLAERIPQLSSDMYSTLNTYNLAIKRTNALTLRAQKLFLRRLDAELKGRKSV